MIKKKKSRKIELDAPSVNITPLLDVLTVLLFFLIKSMAVNSINLEPPKDVKLPLAQSKEEAQESTKLTMTKTSILVDGIEIVKLTAKGKYRRSDIDSDGRAILPLKEFLLKKIEKKHRFYKNIGDISKLPSDKILIQADKKGLFKEMKYILHTIAIAGYNSYQFVIIPES
jgi:biopolymer transport protein ExbD